MHERRSVEPVAGRRALVSASGRAAVETEWLAVRAALVDVAYSH